MISAQGGDPRVVDRPDDFLPLAPFRKEVNAGRDGFVQAMDTRRIGMVISRLGSGRSRPGDAVDHGVGAIFRKKRGDAVKKGDSLATLIVRREEGVEELIAEYRGAVVIGPKRPRPRPLVQGLIR
jgi:thymidine phosphorylase